MVDFGSVCGLMSWAEWQDVQTAVIYDHFTPFVLTQLEEFGFCKRGEAKDFIRDGHVELGGGLPINTHGGQLGEAYIHGMNGIAEAVRQIRGSAVNQVPRVENVVVTAGTGYKTIQVDVSWEDATGASRTLSVSTVVTDYTP